MLQVLTDMDEAHHERLEIMTKTDKTWNAACTHTMLGP